MGGWVNWWGMDWVRTNTHAHMHTIHHCTFVGLLVTCLTTPLFCDMMGLEGRKE
jgi:hypothetical protein